jgi:hypothetical protein
MRTKFYFTSPLEQIAKRIKNPNFKKEFKEKDLVPVPVNSDAIKFTHPLTRFITPTSSYNSQQVSQTKKKRNTGVTPPNMQNDMLC